MTFYTGSVGFVTSATTSGYTDATADSVTFATYASATTGTGTTYSCTGVTTFDAASTYARAALAVGTYSVPNVAFSLVSMSNFLPSAKL